MPRPSLSRLLAGIAVAVPAALLLGAPPASAHPMPHSVVLLDVHDASVTADLELPVTDFATASGLNVTSGPLPTDAIRSYLIAHIKPVTDGRAWTVSIGAVALSRAEQTSTGPYRELLASATLTPPPGGSVRRFTLGYDVIVHQVVTHTALVSVRHDWSAGRTSAATLGTIRIDIRTMTVPPLTVDLGRASAWRGFEAMLRLGGEHILTGTDHLLFLLILLLPAPLLAVRRRWRSTAPTRVAIARIGRTTLAFTIGHSVALALSTFGRLDIPAWPVEAFIAASILIGAIHAIRPLFPGREALVAGVFGLGHGMAFSFTLAEMQLSTGQLALSLLGFNLGIELVQLLLVALALPTILATAHLGTPLPALSRLTAGFARHFRLIGVGAAEGDTGDDAGDEGEGRRGNDGRGRDHASERDTGDESEGGGRRGNDGRGRDHASERGRGDGPMWRVCDVVRVGGATVTAIAAAGWLADRLGAPNPVARAADSAGGHTTPMLIALAVAGLAATAWSIFARRRATGHDRTQPSAGVAAGPGNGRERTRGSAGVAGGVGGGGGELAGEGEDVGRGQPVGVRDQ